MATLPVSESDTAQGPLPVAPPQQRSNSCKENEGFSAVRHHPFKALNNICAIAFSSSTERHFTIRADFSDVIFVLGLALPLLQAAQSGASSCLPTLSWLELIHLAPPPWLATVCHANEASRLDLAGAERG